MSWAHVFHLSGLAKSGKESCFNNNNNNNNDDDDDDDDDDIDDDDDDDDDDNEKEDSTVVLHLPRAGVGLFYALDKVI